jgi:hypothetical protein
LILLIIDAALAKCNEKIAVSTEEDLCPKLDKGGYTVHLVPTLPSIIEPSNNINTAGNINQYDKLFIRGNAISGTLQYNGTNIFLNLEIRLGIKKKKIITKACAVVRTLK